MARTHGAAPGPEEGWPYQHHAVTLQSTVTTIRGSVQTGENLQLTSLSKKALRRFWSGK